jgi:prepilin-type N-terminal cleavage/methylation domain-containing protein
MTLLQRVRRLAGLQRGYTLLELLTVMSILSVIVGALVTLFIRATNAELDMNRRFQAQGTARVAVDRMRREIHCASQISPTGTSALITVTVPWQCPTGSGPGPSGAPGPDTSVIYDVVGAGSQRFQLRRNSVKIADYLTAQNAFDYTAPVAGSSRGKLRVTLPINTEPQNGLKEWRLVADMVLRNTTR